MAPGILVTLVIILTLAATVQQYHAADVPGVSGITTWTQGTPELSLRPGVVGGFSAVADGDNRGGGLFTFWIPVDAGGPHEVALHLINSEQLARAYRYINLCISVTPAVEQDGRLLQDAAAFIHATEEAGGGDCQVLNPGKGSVTFTIEPAHGTTVDRTLNTVSSPVYTGPHAYAFNLGVSAGSYLAMSAGDYLSPTFILDVD